MQAEAPASGYATGKESPHMTSSDSTCYPPPLQDRTWFVLTSTEACPGWVG